MKTLITLFTILLTSSTVFGNCSLDAKFKYKTSGLEVAFTNITSGNWNTIEWSFDDGAVYRSENPEHVFNTAGTHQFSLTVSSKNGCVDTFEGKVHVFNTPKPQQAVSASAKTELPKLNAELNSFPNPFQSSANIVLGLDKASNVNLQLVDITGRTLNNIVSAELGAGEHNFQLERNNLPAGTYLLVLSVDQVSQNKIIVIQ